MKKQIYFSFIISCVSIGLLSVHASAMPDGGFSTDLYYGLTSSSDVIKLQRFLTEKGFYSGPITGSYFSLTLAGVKQFQKANGISQTGYFGPASRLAAQKALVKVVAIEAALTLMSPTNVQSIEEGDTQSIFWASENYPAHIEVHIYLLQRIGSYPKRYELVKKIAVNTPNDGQESWVPQPDEVGENMLIQIACSSRVGTTGCRSITSDSTFNLVRKGSVNKPSGLANIGSATEQ